MNIFKTSEYNALVEELEELIEMMDFPAKRSNDYRWLLRNLGFRNSNNPDFPRAEEILKLLLKGEEL